MPVEIGVHDEVDDAGDSVRAVNRRCAAGQDFARLISADGMTLRSADWVVLFGSPGIMRRPLISASERFEPR